MASEANPTKAKDAAEAWRAYKADCEDNSKDARLAAQFSGCAKAGKEDEGMGRYSGRTEAAFC